MKSPPSPDPAAPHRPAPRPSARPPPPFPATMKNHAPRMAGFAPVPTPAPASNRKTARIPARKSTPPHTRSPGSKTGPPPSSRKTACHNVRNSPCPAHTGRRAGNPKAQTAGLSASSVTSSESPGLRSKRSRNPYGTTTRFILSSVSFMAAKLAFGNLHVKKRFGRPCHGPNSGGIRPPCQ